MVTKQLFDKSRCFNVSSLWEAHTLGMPVYSEHAIAAYFAYFPHIFRAYFKLDRSAYFEKNLRYKLACLIKDLFENAEAQNITDFIKETHFYKQL